jgi:hypothetical protein
MLADEILNQYFADIFVGASQSVQQVPTQHQRQRGNG